MKRFPSVVVIVLTGAVSFPTWAMGQSRDFNPAISANSLLLYADGLIGDDQDDDDHAHGASVAGFSVQETELQFSATVDPYTRADLVFSMHGTEGIELEEGFVTSTSLPRGFAARAGKFFLPLGSHNTLHTHRYPFVDRPLAWTEILGEEGLNGAALEVAWLSPLPWYAEFTMYGFPSTEVIWGNEDAPRSAWALGWRVHQFWDSGSRSTVELGLSFAGGPSEWDARGIAAVDARWKWQGRGTNRKSAELHVEWLRRLDEIGHDEPWRKDDGAYIHALAKVSRRVSVGARYDLLIAEQGAVGGHDHGRIMDVGTEGEGGRLKTHTITGSLAFVASEFLAFRADAIHREFSESNELGVRMQLNFTIGSHPAHVY